MFLKGIKLKNWKNFQSCDLKLGQRLFVVGPNASGKSNLLDAVKFLKDLSKPGGGLQTAVQNRGGFSKIRCLSARQNSQVEITVELARDLNNNSEPDWKYFISIKQETRGKRRPLLKHEKVWRKGELIVNRPDKADDEDEERLTQTHLEQINANKEFRDIARYFSSTQYLHIVPQLVRHSKLYTGPGVPGDPFGHHFLNKIAETAEGQRKSRLKKIEQALKRAVPQLKGFSFTKDKRGYPHLEAVYQHWRPKGAGKQREDQMSDGTLRLLGFLWALLDGPSLLLLEEPELSLHPAIVRQLAELIFKVLKNKRQIIVTTHSVELLDNRGIGSSEVAILELQAKEGTRAQIAGEKQEIKNLMENGLTASEAVIPRTAPDKVRQLPLSI